MASLLANFCSNHFTIFSKFIPEDYYVASLLAIISGFPYMASLLANFCPNHFTKYFEIYPRRLLCGQLACHFFRIPIYMVSLLANFCPNHFTNISKFFPEDYYMASLLAIHFSKSAN